MRNTKDEIIGNEFIGPLGEILIVVKDKKRDLGCSQCYLWEFIGGCDKIMKENYLPGCTESNVMFHYELKNYETTI